MARETQYTVKTGIVKISTANSNLDGSGTLGNIITGANNGTLIKKLYIKATGNTTKGMIRIFVNSWLICEIDVPAITYSGNTPAFETEVEMNFALQSGVVLKASTQNAETFNIIAEGLDWNYYTNSVRTDTTQFTTNWGAQKLAIANTNLNGTGTIYDVYTAFSTTDYKGSSVINIVIRDLSTVSDGMIRLYIKKSATYYLFKEVFVPATIGSSGIVEQFQRIVDFDNDFELQASCSISASTEVAETYAFEVSIMGNDWKYLN